MQSVIYRRSARALASRTLRPQVSQLQARRNYPGEAGQNEGDPRGPGGEPQGTTTRIPLIAAVGLACMIPLYYFTQATVGTGNKAPGAGQAAIKEKRRTEGAAGETRDPRDSGKKTSEADKR